MEKDVPCYLCQVYKATGITKDGVPICLACKHDLHEEAEKGEELVKKQLTFKGTDVKLTINNKEIKPFKVDFNESNLHQPVFIDPDDTQQCCEDYDCCDCDDDFYDCIDCADQGGLCYPHSYDIAAKPGTMLVRSITIAEAEYRYNYPGRDYVIIENL
jgi:hypothetical protein